MTKKPGSVLKPNIAASDLAAGGGSGGALIYVVNTYIPDPKLQALLIYLVPTISIVFMSIYSFASQQTSERWKAYEAESTRQKLLTKAKAALVDAKTQLYSIEADANATSEHKIAARERVQKIERAVLELSVKGIVTIE